MIGGRKKMVANQRETDGPATAAAGHEVILMETE